MNEDKVYYPETIVENPFPNQDSVVPITNTPSPGIYNPTTSNPKAFPKKFVAHETIAQALNTKTRKILQKFEFTPSGSLQIGEFENGISGDIRITPNGVTARDTAGLTTFSIDGTTGEAVFKGEVQAADFVVVDSEGLISLANFQIDNATSLANFTTTSQTYVDITDMSLTTPPLSRPAFALVFFQSSVFGTQASSPGTSFSGEIFVITNVNGTLGNAPIRMRAGFNSSTGEANSDITTISGHDFVSLNAGVNTIKIQMKISDFGNFKAAAVNNSMSYIILGR